MKPCETPSRCFAGTTVARDCVTQVQARRRTTEEIRVKLEIAPAPVRRSAICVGTGATRATSKQRPIDMKDVGNCESGWLGFHDDRNRVTRIPHPSPNLRYPLENTSPESGHKTNFPDNVSNGCTTLVTCSPVTLVGILFM
jgi:hypothetical protein